jgi:hypothetical protein
MKTMNKVITVVVAVLALPWVWVVAEKVLSSKVVGMWTKYVAWVDRIAG